MPMPMPLPTSPDASLLALPASVRALVFEDPKSIALLERIRAVAPSHGTVLITGETGTGKELVARHVHELSRGATLPFLALSCAAFSESLAETELFGHASPAGTEGIGWFEAAHGGTLFLDEVADLPLTVQAKLLRVLQEGEIVRVGSQRALKVDVRLIVATNVDLEHAVSVGAFREDLFYRLNVVPLSLPALRERVADILPLARHFLEVYGERLGGRRAELSPDAASRLLEHSWPGNVRELENVIHQALLVYQGPQITALDLKFTTLKPKSPAPRSRGGERSLLDEALFELFEQGQPRLYERIEETVMRAAFRYCESNQLQTARLLGISRNVVRARLIQFGEIPGTLRSARRPDPESTSVTDGVQSVTHAP